MVEKTFHIIRKSWILGGRNVNFLIKACLAVRDSLVLGMKEKPLSFLLAEQIQESSQH